MFQNANPAGALIPGAAFSSGSGLLIRNTDFCGKARKIAAGLVFTYVFSEFVELDYDLQYQYVL
jgi:hypothetical protein